MEDVKVSVIVPVYNAEKTVERCINSILGQTYKNIELIIVNDGSTDSSAEIVNQYCQVDKRIVLIEQENEGVSSARNQGLNRATGEWIAFVDADDYLDGNCLASVLPQAIITDTELVLWNRIDVYQNRMEEKRVFYSRENCKISCKELIEKVFYNMEGNIEVCSACCRLFYRQIILEKRLSFDKELSQGEDLIFMLDYLMNTDKATWCNVATYFRTMRNDSALHQYSPNIQEKTYSLLIKIVERLNSMTEERIKKFYNIYVLRGPITTCMECFICNDENRRSRRERAIQLNSVLENEKVKTALKEIDYRDLPMRLKVKLFCVRHKIMIVLDRWYRTKKYM